MFGIAQALVVEHEKIVVAMRDCRGEDIAKAARRVFPHARDDPADLDLVELKRQPRPDQAAFRFFPAQHGVLGDRRGTPTDQGSAS